MKKSAIALFSLVALFAATTSFASNAVRISQVYGGGGGGLTSGATYTKDYVELFNNSGTAVDISGYSLCYGSSTGTWGTSFIPSAVFTFPSSGVLIQPCRYLLISTGTAGAGGGALPVVPDYDAPTINMSAGSGKIGLFTLAQVNVACGAETGLIIDKVGYGAAAVTCAEGSAAGGSALSNTQGVVRNGAGTIDSDNNLGDFTVTLAPVPRNSLSPANTGCLSTPAAPSTWGMVKNIYR